jgi:glycosyltransferase involved in cell wall biosynthesis
MESKLRLYYWVHHTGITATNTGIQRLVRTLASGLVANGGVDLIPVRWCAGRQAIVRADRQWLRGVAMFDGPVIPEPEEAGEALHLSAADSGQLSGAWLLIPEVTHLPVPPHAPNGPLALVLDYARYYGLRSGIIFYDLIPLRHPGYETMVPEHSRYAQALFGADLIVPISVTSAEDLWAWWQEQAYPIERAPAVQPLLLSGEMPGVPRVTQSREATGQGLRMAAFGTILERKNQLSLMRAFNRIKQRRPELDLHLDLMGAIEPSIKDIVHAEVKASNGMIRLHGTVSDETLCEIVDDSDATAFVSLLEGFGLPLAESLWLGRPCLCSNFGSMAEIAASGGCLTVDPRDSAAIEAAIESLATNADLLRQLSQQAIGLPLKSHADYAAAVLDELKRLPKISRLAVIEGSRGGAGEVFESLVSEGVAVKRLHWRLNTQSILPGFRDDRKILQVPGDGDLRRSWVLLPLGTVSNMAEAATIEDELRARGARLAVWVEPERRIDPTFLSALRTTDLVLFSTPSDHDAGLAGALRHLERTTTVRHRYRVAQDIKEVIAALAQERERIAAPGFARAVKRIYYWCGLTGTQRFNSGIQRCVRTIGSSLVDLGIDLIPVKWNDTDRCLSALNEEEAEVLALWGGPPARRPEPLPADLSGEWLFIVEVPLPLKPPGSNPIRLGRSLGMQVAVAFHDLIVHKMPELYNEGTHIAWAEYYEMLSESDIIIPVSWTVAGDIGRYLAERGLKIPSLVPCPSAGELSGVPRTQTLRSKTTSGLNLLAVGTLEPRKNYPRLIRAIALARTYVPHIPISLTIVGRSSGYNALETEITELAAAVGGIDLRGSVSDAELVELYKSFDLTVYASWEEGFGLPVLESFWQGLPCLCHDGSSLAEVAEGGGALAVNMLDEEAIARGIEVLATDDALYNSLCQEVVTQPIRSWSECAEDILLAMSRTGAAPGWPAPAVRTAPSQPLLTCAISTYNRAGWLHHSLDRLIEATAPWRDSIEVVVCDNTSTDHTPEVVARYAGVPGFTAKRNPVNVGMLGNLGMTARACRGEFTWILGDDDLIIDGAIEQVLTGLERNRDVEMAYMNYAYTRFDAPEELADAAKVIRDAIPIAYGGGNRRVDEVREVAGLNENQFTAIYACAFRSDHAMRAYQQDMRGAPFSSLPTCVPSTVYALTALADRPALWLGQPALVVNMNVSWLRWVLLWHLGRMHDIFQLSELAGVDPVRLDRYRFHHVYDSGSQIRKALFAAEDSIRAGVSVDRFLERAKHIEAIRSQLPLIYTAYAEAWTAGRVVADVLPPEELFARHGLSEYIGEYKEDSRSAIVNAIYRVALGRDADEGGMRSYSDLLQKGAPPEELVRQLVNSEEFRSRGGRSDLLARLGVPA